MKKILALFLQSRIYGWLLKHVIPFIRFTTYYSDFTGLEYEPARQLVQRCDVILTTDDLKLTSKIIPGIVDHAALCLSDHREIAQMTHKDFTIDTMFDLCKESTRVIIMRCPDIWKDPNYMFHMTNKCRGFAGSKYDGQFKLGVEALYCSELVYQADYDHRINCDLTDLAGLGRPYISPTGLLLSENMYCVYDSNHEFDSLTGKEIEKKLRNAGKIK
jgi:hypothetical protein